MEAESAIQVNQISPVRLGRLTGLRCCSCVHRGISHITVFKATEGGSMIGDISWNSSENGSRNSINGWLNIESDEFEQHLSGGNFSASDTKGMSPHDAAQMVWSEFIARAGVVDA